MIKLYKNGEFLRYFKTVKSYLQKKHSLKTVIQWYNMIFKFNTSKE